ncbi:hypothetical protein NPIL_497721, partial [Nephila pilipes]
NEPKYGKGRNVSTYAPDIADINQIKMKS